MADKLRDYRGKRDFDKTAEPHGSGERRPGRSPRFVVQKHDASSLHYDVRLEVGGVLRSWAVPKGPSTSPTDKRLAMATADHPIEYADFEGVIPAGEYGAGTVLVWDTGTFRNLTEHDGREVDPADALDGGHLTVWLEGEKLGGGYAFTRMSRKPGEQRWLMVKMDDERADARRKPTRTQPRSVLSGEDLDGVAAGSGGC